MHKLLAACTLVIAIVANPATAGEPFFMGLGHLEGYDGASAIGISGDGRVVVGSSTSWPSGDSMAYRWTLDTGMVPLGDIPGGDVWSSSTGISYDGSIIVGYGKSASSTPGDHYEAFKWTARGGMVGLGDLPGGHFDSRASAVSADGTVIVGRGYQLTNVGAGSVEAARWVADHPIERITPYVDDRRGWASDVSADGSVIAGTNDELAMIWTEENGVVSLGNIPGAPAHSSSAYAISANGQVVVGQYCHRPENVEAFVWSESTGMIGIGGLPGGNDFTTAYDVSADGEIVVGSSHSSVGTRPFIWDEENGMRNLQDVLISEYGFDLTDWSRLRAATSVSDDGLTIAGVGYRAGKTEPWVAHLPEPGSVIMFLSIGTLSLRHRRMRA